jgi:hypothetical protein
VVLAPEAFRLLWGKRCLAVTQVFAVGINVPRGERGLLDRMGRHADASTCHARPGHAFEFSSEIHAPPASTTSSFECPLSRTSLLVGTPCSKLWADEGFGSERFGRLRCVFTRANLQPAVANYVRRRGDAAWRALALDVLRIEEGIITEIVTFAELSAGPFCTARRELSSGADRLI